MKASVRIFLLVLLSHPFIELVCVAGTVLDHRPQAAAVVESILADARTSFLGGDGVSALEHSENAAKRATEAGDLAGQALAVRLASISSGRLGNWPVAVELAAREAKLWGQLGYGPGEVEALLRQAFLSEITEPRKLHPLLRHVYELGQAEKPHSLHMGAVLNAGGIAALEVGKLSVGHRLLRLARELLQGTAPNSLECVAVLHNGAALAASSFIGVDEAQQLLSEAERLASTQPGPAALGLVSIHARWMEVAALLGLPEREKQAAGDLKKQLRSLDLSVLGLFDSDIDDLWLIPVVGAFGPADFRASYRLQPFDDRQLQLAVPEAPGLTAKEYEEQGVMTRVLRRPDDQTAYANLIVAIAQTEGWIGFAESEAEDYAAYVDARKAPLDPSERMILDMMNRQAASLKAMKIEILMPELSGEPWPRPAARASGSVSDQSGPTLPKPVSPSAQPVRPKEGFFRRLGRGIGLGDIIPLPSLPSEPLINARGPSAPEPADASVTTPHSGGLSEILKNMDYRVSMREYFGPRVVEQWSTLRSQLFRDEMIQIGLGTQTEAQQQAEQSLEQATAQTPPIILSMLRGIGGLVQVPAAVEYLVANNRPSEAVELMADVRAVRLWKRRAENQHLRTSDSSRPSDYGGIRMNLLKVEEAYLEALQAAWANNTPAHSPQALLPAAQKLQAEWEREAASWREVQRLKLDLLPARRSFDEVGRELPADTLMVLLDTRLDSKGRRSTAGLVTLLLPPEVPGARREIIFKPIRVSNLAVESFRLLCAGGDLGSGSSETTAGSLERAARVLFQQLFPADAGEAVRKAERIVLCPSQRFWDIPYAALVMNNSEPAQYLGLRKSLTFGPSLESMSYENQPAAPSGGEQRGREVVVLGGVAFDSRPGSAYELLRIESLRTLSRTEDEASRVARLYGVEAVTGADATEQALRGRAPDAALIHLATHGLSYGSIDSPVAPWAAFVRQRGGFPGVWLAAPKTPSTHHDDGLLQAWEIIAGLQLHCDLVVLAACETGQAFGMLDAPELPSAFLAAGARSVVACLWKVDDEATAQCMTEMHRHLHDGARADDAIRLAMNSVQQSPKYHDPRFWAAYTLFGSGAGLSLAARN